MIKKILVTILLLQASYMLSQQSTSSPYSLFGLGLEKFKGTNASRAMAGLSAYSDVGNQNLLNPATYANLKLTSFAVGGTYTNTNIKAAEGTGKGAATTFDYLALGIPAGKFGIGLGIVPYRSVGYNVDTSGLIDENGDEFDQSLEGLGNLNRLYLSIGSEVAKGFKLGAELQYNFGRLEEQITVFPSTTFASRFIFQSDISGLSYKLAAMYDFDLYEDLQISTYIMYDGSGEFTAINSEERATVSPATGAFSVDEEIVEEEDRVLGIPTKITMGFAATKKNLWHFATESYIGENADYTDRRLDRDDVVFTDSYGIKAGGFYIPKYNSLTNYMNRITYRAGIRYDKIGLQVFEEDIDEFGISFGFGLPLPREFSNLDISFEAGSRGLVTENTVKENFFSISLGLSVSQKWFRKRKYD